MTAAEKYYAFLDSVWPMNLMLVAGLDRVLPPDLVERRWREFTERRILARLRPAADLTVLDGGADLAFGTTQLTAGGLQQELARESRIHHGMERPLICRYWTDEGAGRSWVCLIGHHSTVDARGGISELQHFIRFLAGHEIEGQEQISLPEPPSGDHQWQRDRGELVSLLRELGRAQEAAGPPGPADWPEPSRTREPRFSTVVVTPDRSSALLQEAAHHGTRAFPSLAAAAMVAVAEVVCVSGEETLQLNVPTDLTVSRDDPDRPSAVNVAVLSHRHRVQPGEPWDLARRVDECVRRARERGEGDLFFHLTRVARVEDLDRGARLVEESVRSAPAAVSVTNLGVVDERADPPWLATLAAHQAPTPNQVISSIGLAYRGQQVLSIATDDVRLDPVRAERLVAAYGEVLDAMASGRYDR